MAYVIIDRRKNGKGKSIPNRKKFLDRIGENVKNAAKKILSDSSIVDIIKDGEETVNIPTKDLEEPSFYHTSGGNHEMVYPGNVEFIKGDLIGRPPEGKGNGKGSSDGGDGDDDFSFNITRKEFLEYFFDGLELPNLEDKPSVCIEEFKQVRAGFTSTGSPSRLSIIRSMMGSMSRKAALKTPKIRRIANIEEKLKMLYTDLVKDYPSNILSEIIKLEDRILKLNNQIGRVPFIDELDLKYRNFTTVPNPINQAVMFCLMDVSGSMGEFEKDLAKRFFMLLFLFLNKNYEKIEVVFIRYHTAAKEVTEDEFFYSTETGGTIVSPSIELMAKTISEKYHPSKYNIYCAHCTDGDNWSSDNEKVLSLLRKSILPIVQYYMYVEVGEYNGDDDEETDMSAMFGMLNDECNNMAIGNIYSASMAYSIFQELFKKK